MKSKMNSDQQNNIIHKEYSKCDSHPNVEHHTTEPNISSRIPLPVMFEEEGTQTENSTNEFLYEDPDQEGQTRVDMTDTNRSQVNFESRLQERGSVSSSSSRISQQGSHHGGNVRCDFIQDSSYHSESGDSVIERLSKSVSRLLKPESLRNRIDRSTQTAKDPVVWETEKLAFDIVFYALGRRGSANSGEGDVIRCLRISVQKMLDNHSLVFNGMMTRLRIEETIQQSGSCDFNKGFNDLAEELFVQNEVSWGKIVALFAFGARLAQHCSETLGKNDLVFDVATNLADFAVRKLTPFLKQNGGWITLCYAFPMESDYESKIWRTLLLTGIGLTTVAAIISLQR